MRRDVVALFIAFFCAAAAPVSASTRRSDPKAEARLHFDRGVALAKNGQYGEAISAFSRAYSASPHFAVLFNLGQAYGAVGQPVFAADTLRRYLNEGGGQVPPSRRVQVEADIARYEKQIALVTVRSAIDGAVIRMDQVEVGRTPLTGPARLAPGAHVLTAHAAGYRPWSQQFTVGPGESRTLEVRPERDSAVSGVPATSSSPPPGQGPPQVASLGAVTPGAAASQPAASAPSAASAPAPAPAFVPTTREAYAGAGADATAGTLQARPVGEPATPPGGVGPSRWLPGLVVLGAGIVAAGAATGVLIWNYGRNEAHEAEVAKHASTPPSAEVANNLNERAESIRNVSYLNVALGVGSAALVTTGIILLWRASADAEAGQQARGPLRHLVIGPGTVGWRAAF